MNFWDARFSKMPKIQNLCIFLVLLSQIDQNFWLLLQYRQRMQLKRNYGGNIQPPTQLKPNLINPLINISKASTPVRMRVVKPQSQLNSTPVNVHKIMIGGRSPVVNNKENDEGNRFLAPQNKLQINSTGNLSPIMALHRKNVQVASPSQRSFTPLGFKRQESAPVGLQLKQSQGQAPLHESRSSNSFRGMLQSRARTPSRSPLSQKLMQSNQFNMQGSNTNTLYPMNNKLKDSRNVKLAESKNFQHLSGLGSPGVKDGEVLCSNSAEHEKKVKAKYKVIDDSEDEDLLVYCSKCAINLVQKGFKVQDLTQQDIARIKQTMPSEAHPDPQPQYQQYTQTMLQKLQSKQAELYEQRQNLDMYYRRKIEDSDCYYDSIIAMVQSQKNRDRDGYERMADKDRKVGDGLLKRVGDCIGQLGFAARRGVTAKEIPMIRDAEFLLDQRGFSGNFQFSQNSRENVQEQFDNFSRYFHSQGKLKQSFQSVPSQSQYQSQGQSFQHYNSPGANDQYFSGSRKGQDHPLRFSFQKSLKENRRSPFGIKNTQMKALEEAPQALEGEDSGEIEDAGEKKAFRTLFPEEEEEYGNADQKQDISSPTFKQI